MHHSMTPCYVLVGVTHVFVGLTLPTLSQETTPTTLSQKTTPTITHAVPRKQHPLTPTPLDRKKKQRRCSSCDLQIGKKHIFAGLFPAKEPCVFTIEPYEDTWVDKQHQLLPTHLDENQKETHSRTGLFFLFHPGMLKVERAMQKWVSVRFAS